MANILLIDDERSIRMTLKEILEYENHKIDEAEGGERGLEMMIQEDYDAILCDIKMPKMDGISVLEKAQSLGIETPFIMVSAHATIDTAVEATKKGAFDFIQKPPELNRLLVTVKNALEVQKLVAETTSLKKKIHRSSEIIGQSQKLTKVLETIDRVAPTDARVMITGPNGSGKELVARALHTRSSRSHQPLVEVNCAAIPSELIESELFGHEKGSFTSAVKQRKGKFELAHEGTLFLDEIGDMSLSAQAKVLRALQEHKITRVGGDKEIKVDVRVFAATNKNLKVEIAEKRFREDLYHRLNVIHIQVPPLKERAEDIPLLVDKFLKDIAKEYGTKPKDITTEAISELQKLEWTGNIRELRNVTERLIILSGDTITLEDVSLYAEA